MRIKIQDSIHNCKVHFQTDVVPKVLNIKLCPNIGTVAQRSPTILTFISLYYTEHSRSHQLNKSTRYLTVLTDDASKNANITISNWTEI